MTFAVRPASLSGDRSELISLLRRNLPDSTTGAQFRWRHEGNPAGPGWSWVVYERKNGAVRAMTSLFPRPMYCDGRLILCGQVGEFVVDRGCRSLGPAVMLQRATFQPVDSGDLSLCYDCPPHDQGMSTFVRLGMRASCELRRYAILLRSNQVLERRLGKGAWTRPVTAAANFLLSLKRYKHCSPGIEIQTLAGEFDDEFTHLDKAVPTPNIFRSSRSADLLNWRFRERSEADIQVLVARCGGEVLAFIALMICTTKRASILDLFGRKLEIAGLPLLSSAIELCRRKDAMCLEGYCSPTSPLRSLFEAMGFRAREKAARIVAYEKPRSVRRYLSSRMSWPVGSAELSI